MKAYFLRRLLLVPITLLGVTLIVFFVSRTVPGGPIDLMLQQASQASEGGKSSDDSSSALSDAQMEELEEQFGYDKPSFIAYLQWLGAWPKEQAISKADFRPSRRLQADLISDPNTQALVTLAGTNRQAIITRSSAEATEVASANFLKSDQPIASQGWSVRIESPLMRLERQARRKRSNTAELIDESLSRLALSTLTARELTNTQPAESAPTSKPTWSSDPRLNDLIRTRLAIFQESDAFLRACRALDFPQEQLSLNQLELEQLGANLSLSLANSSPFRCVAFQGRFSGLIQGDLGRSSTYNDPVINMIIARLPIALYFGLLTALITYGICIPLGILKALKHRTLVDNVTSVIIFVGYSVPGFALGAVLLVFLGARMDLFPLAGLVSENFSELSSFGKLKNLAHHTVLPLLSYVIGGFAITTMMMKNNLMDNLAADYVRTAVAKGVSFRAAVFRHAFRNSFIPIATGLGQLITLMVAGSMLIEQVFDIPGFGLLKYQAIKDVDINVIMGTLTFAALLLLIGNILSDLIVALIDPRIKFH